MTVTGGGIAQDDWEFRGELAVSVDRPTVTASFRDLAVARDSAVGSEPKRPTTQRVSHARRSSEAAVRVWEDSKPHCAYCWLGA